MVPREQLICARWLELGTRGAFAFVLATFALYVLGILEPLVPVDELNRLWGMPVDRYIAATGAATGWGWLRLLGKGDYLNIFGIALFVLVAIACFARLSAAFLAEGKRLQATFALLQVIVLLVAASGLIR